MNKNQVIEITIEDLSHEGTGIGHTDGVTIFVKDALPHDVVEAVITKVKKNYCFATVKRVIKPSEYRVEPKCPIYRRCGGCQIMQLDYAKQLEIKQSMVRSNLIRLGGFDAEYIDSIMEPIIGMPDPFKYRNKAQIPISTDKEGKLVYGFYGARSHRVVPTDHCDICSDRSFEIAGEVVAFMKNKGITSYNEENGQGLIRHVLVREGAASGQVMVCLVTNGDKLPCATELCDLLTQKHKDITSIVQNINTRRDNVILGFETKVLWGEEAIEDSITLSTGDTVSFKISANSFYQVNHDQMELLYSKALEYAQLTGNESVWDLYCGIGTISLCMATKAKQVYGVEVVPQAIENAKANAKLNNIDNATFFCGEAEQVLPDYYKNNASDTEMLHPDVIVVDPPRKGCDERCLSTMVDMNPERIVYVSCDSATLSRDLKYLSEKGYKPVKITIVDQFGHTMHTETVVKLVK